MSDHTDTLGGRLPLADPATLNSTQREIFDRMATRIVPWANDAHFQGTAEDGRFIGPFNPALLNPAIAAPFLDLQFAEQVHTSLSERVREVVILAVDAVWQADYELYARLAVAQGGPFRRGRTRTVVGGGLPDDLSDDEEIALRLTRQLSTSHRVDESLYREAENRFTTKGLIDIAFLIGIYHSVRATLTMFAIPAPE